MAGRRNRLCRAFGGRSNLLHLISFDSLCVCATPSKHNNGSRSFWFFFVLFFSQTTSLPKEKI